MDKNTQIKEEYLRIHKDKGIEVFSSVLAAISKKYSPLSSELSEQDKQYIIDYLKTI